MLKITALERYINESIPEGLKKKCKAPIIHFLLYKNALFKLSVAFLLMKMFFRRINFMVTLPT